MKYLIYFIIISLLVAAHVGILDFMKLYGATSDILLLFVIGCCLQREAEDSFFVAFISGLYLDYFNGIFVGSFTLAFLLLTLLLYITIHRLVVLELTWKYLLAVVVGATVLTDLFVWAANAAAFRLHWSAVMIDIPMIRSHLPFELVLNIVLAYPLYLLATWLRNFILGLEGKAHRIL